MLTSLGSLGRFDSQTGFAPLLDAPADDQSGQLVLRHRSGSCKSIKYVWMCVRVQ